jgi:hypothetical protein
VRAAALQGLGRHDEARDLLEEELALARAWGTPRLVGRTLRLGGQLQGGAGAPDLREAVELLSGEPPRSSSRAPRSRSPRSARRTRPRTC